VVLSAAAILAPVLVGVIVLALGYAFWRLWHRPGGDHGTA
jgi:hypothetical protein